VGEWESSLAEAKEKLDVEARMMGKRRNKESELVLTTF
jgi:hypothetical protein